MKINFKLCFSEQNELRTCCFVDIEININISDLQRQINYPQSYFT